MSRKSEVADNIDKHVGQRIRQLRVQMGISQSELAELVDVTYQQIHKYEKGTNRISAGRLAIIARECNVSTDYFYEGLDGAETLYEEEDTSQRIQLDMARYFKQITNPKQQEAVYNLVRSLAGATQNNALM